MTTESSQAAILVVDDDEDVRDLVQRILVRRGHAVTSVESATAAVTLLSDPDRRIDLVISDLHMPGVTGTELADEVARLRPGLHVLYVSGDPGGTSGRPVVAKPFTAAQLSDKVAQLLESPV